MATIDLNCDMGEGCGSDAELMKYVSSANIACRFHAGDAQTMHETVGLALDNGVAIGAHPGYRDAEHFGRRSMQLSAKEVVDLVEEQIRAMQKVCEESGAILHHVKPHGALYNDAAKDREMATAIAEAVLNVDPSLILYGLSGSFLISAADELGLRTASEVFADRTYRKDGTLTPRTEPNALIASDAAASDQAMQMITSSTVIATTGDAIAIKAETLCIHGDGEHAVEFAKAIHAALGAGGITVATFGSQE